MVTMMCAHPWEIPNNLINANYLSARLCCSRSKAYKIFALIPDEDKFLIVIEGDRYPQVWTDRERALAAAKTIKKPGNPLFFDQDYQSRLAARRHRR